MTPEAEMKSLIAAAQAAIEDPNCTGWTCPNCRHAQYHAYGFDCDECGYELASAFDLQSALKARSV